MSLITQSCDRLLACLQRNFPWDSERFQPGLTLEEIEIKVKDLTFPLPQEVRELYQWRNGNPSGNLLIPGKLAGCQNYFWFMPSLEQALDIYFLRGGIETIRKKDGEYIKWNRNWFPIFQSLHERLFHVVELGQGTSKVFLFDPKAEEYERLCDSLTELLVTEADFFEEQSEEKPWLY